MRRLTPHSALSTQHLALSTQGEHTRERERESKSNSNISTISYVTTLGGATSMRRNKEHGQKRQLHLPPPASPECERTIPVIILLQPGARYAEKLAQAAAAASRRRSSISSSQPVSPPRSADPRTRPAWRMQAAFAFWSATERRVCQDRKSHV